MSLKDFMCTAPPAGRYVCPACGGGSSKEQSLQVYESDQGWSAICYRDTCGERYFNPANPEHRIARNIQSNNKLMRYVEPELRGFSDGEDELLFERYRLESSTLAGWGWRMMQEEPARLYIPLWRQPGNGGTVPVFDGHVERVIHRTHLVPKARTRLNEGAVGRGVYMPDRDMVHSEYIVVVEDMLSAACIRASDRDSVALLGTKMSREQALVMRSWGVPILVALDADATRSAIRIVRDLEPCVDARVVRLTKDVKDMNILEQEEFIARCDALCNGE